MRHDFKAIEEKWQKKWEEARVFEATDDFDKKKFKDLLNDSQAIIGIQMASAYTGSLTMPALFGVIANHVAVYLLPVYLLLLLISMYIMHVKLLNTVKSRM